MILGILPVFLVVVLGTSIIAVGVIEGIAGAVFSEDRIRPMQ
jgi:hypothetical protein